MSVSTRAAVLAASLVAIIAVSCSDGNRGGGPTANGDLVRALAPIESVEVRVAESFPPQYFADIVSALPNGCVRFESLEAERDGDTIRITVWNLAPKPGSRLLCTMIYGITKHSVALGTDFEPGRTYTVHVNGETATFQAQ